MVRLTTVFLNRLLKGRLVSREEWKTDKQISETKDHRFLRHVLLSAPQIGEGPTIILTPCPGLAPMTSDLCGNRCLLAEVKHVYP